MARPRGEDKRQAILAAATRVIAAQGLSAPTAVIAREARVANGSLFTYFPTKIDLLNELYRELKIEMGAAALDGLPEQGDLRQRMLHVWSHGLDWVVACPDKRRALAHLGVSGDITPESREVGSRTMGSVAKLMDQARQNGPMRDAPLGFLLSIMGVLGDATAEFMTSDPARAADHRATAFDALWRMIT